MSYFAKRVLDFLLALTILLLCSPVLVLVALVIKFSSRGPVLFKQTRLTRNAKEFTIYKFRTMHTNFDREGRGIQIKASSQAITSVGRILRRTKLDELPQLFNILRGDMSFVGPRPELPRRLRYYSPKDMHVFDVLSGITSPASIVFSDEEFLMEKVDNPEVFYVQRIMPLKISLNLYYIDKKSFIYDLKIVLTTLLKLFFRLKLTGVVSDQNLLICKSQLREEVLESSR